MNPGKFDLEMYRGDSYSWRFILWRDDEKTDPVDLTGATLDSQIKDKIDGEIVLTVPCNVTLPNIVDISVSPEMYETCPKKGVWDMQVTFPDGEVHTPVHGTVTVSPDVTNSVVSDD